MPKLNREEVDVTSSLKNILDNYPAGSATLREFLQNTDDAGGKSQTFILHNHQFSSTDLVGGELATCQGPAIIATNDAYFKEKDWKAITKILNSSKTQDETSTGKYGLGFRSCYHITDNPHILSHDRLLILDPHARVEKFPGGFELNTKRMPNDEGKIEREVYKDHFATFSAILKPDDDVYSGTAIRLPLRLPGSQSNLKSTPTRVEDARKMFKDFVAKELPEAMLFLKNIREIKLTEIDEKGAETVLATATLEKSDIVGSHSGEGRVKREETSHYRVTITLRIGAALPVARSWIITQFVEKYETASGHMARRLKRPRNDVEEAMSKDKLIPQVALALAIPQDSATAIPEPHGKLFTLLPLPIITNFPVHIDAVLALVSSRQNLRNPVDVEAGDREELLVEWNRAIFSEFVPKAWAALLDHLVKQQSADSSVVPRSTINVFEAWPGPVASQDGDQGYWHPLPARLLEAAARKAVWPLRGKKSQFFTLSGVLVVEEGESAAPLEALEACNVPLVIVPQRVFNLIQMSEFNKAILTPKTAYPYIKKNSRTVSDLDAATRKSICDWLVSANDISLVLDLPIIPQVQNKHTSITSHGDYTVATESEAAIFSTVDQNLIAGALMSPPTRQLLLMGRLRPVGPTEVARYLEKQVPTFAGMTVANISTGVNPTTFEWLIKFWNWLDGWEKLDDLVDDSPAWDTIQNLHALPLRLSGGRPALRLVGKSAVRSLGMDAEVVAALTALEVPMLEGTMSTGSAVQHVSKNHSDVVFILQSLPKNKSFTHLSRVSRQTLHEFFTEQLSNYLQPAGRARQGETLRAESRNVLRTLPIFPIFNPGRRDDNSITFDVAPDGACFVDNSVQVIPSIRGAPFIIHDQGRILHTALEERSILGEIDVLRKAISPDAWSQQDRVAGLLPVLIDGLINRLNALGAAARSRIGELRIVEVGGRRQSPNQVVDPSSGLAGLYDAEDEVLPVGQFAREGAASYVSQLRSYGMIRTMLTPAAIEERVACISDQSRPVKDRAEKGLRLLNLLGSYTQPGTHKLPAEIIEILVNSAWLPAADAFYTPLECWDSRPKDAMLCDLVLPRISVTVETQYLRDCLGWTRIPFAVLQSQLLNVLEASPNSSPTDALDRIEAVLKELASESQARRISQENIMSLVQALEDAAWIPTISRNRCAARQAMLEQIDLGMKYHSVAPSLLHFAGMEALLKQMGIHSRPTQTSLFATLREISAELSETGIAVRTRDGLIRTSVLILEELCRSMEGKDYEFEFFQRTLVPTESWKLAPAPEVLFNDMGGDPTSSPPGFQFAHSQVSASLAYTLGLRRLGEEEFWDGGDGIQSFHMGEDLTNRIRGVLQDYGISHSSNELVANADDAGASSVTFLIDEADEASFQGRRVIPGLNVFQSGLALVVHNDGIFTDADFQGLINVGRGGKSGRADSIGRFGLGALSFYHFSELPWIISGKYCLFLDPSEQYLPRQPGNVKRSTALVPLSVCKSRYPDQLKPLDGLFEFSSEEETYNGTLFRFPLRTADQAKISKLSNTYFSLGDISHENTSCKDINHEDIAKRINSFYANASQSLFFTKSLAKITADRRQKNNKALHIWSVESVPEPISQDGRNDMDASKLSLTLKAPQTSNVVREPWLVTRTQSTREEFPEQFQPLFSHHRLHHPTFGLAMNLSAKGSIPNSRLFATLPLPVSTSLPVHIHATWILAQDRRSIRYDAPDAADQRPLDTLYNEHILEKGIAPLYIKTLALVLLHHPKLVRQFWPKKTQDGPSRVVAAGIHEQIISTQESVLLTSQNQPIPPSQAIIHLSTKAPLAVQRILTELQIPNYVPTPYFDTTFLKDWGDLRFDSAKEVSAILRERATAVKRLWQDTDHTNPSHSGLTSKGVISIFNYLATEGQKLDGIPLLLLGDHHLVEFQSSGHRKIFASHRKDLAKLFGASTVVSEDISEDNAHSLVELNVNVGMLDSRGMRDLLAHHINAVVPTNMQVAGNAERDWHIDLLQFLVSPACPVQLEDVADLPLLPAFGRDLVISLNHAKSGKIWWKSPSEHQALTTILLQLDVIEVEHLPGGTQEVEMIDPGRIIQLFGQLGLSSAQILQKTTPKDWDAFVQYTKPWLHSQYIERLPAAECQTLMALPLFPGRQTMKHVPFASASQVLMLPDSVPLDDLARYLPPGDVFAAYSDDLAAIFARGKNTEKNLSFANLLSRLRIPYQLSQDEYASFLSLLQLIAMHHEGPYNNQLIPDGKRVLRRPHELLDHRVDLFSTAFEGRDDLFVHPNFCHLIDRLVDLGIQRTISSQNLLQCIREVDSDARKGREPVRRAIWLWDYVNTAPPPLREIAFDTIRGLRFLPRHIQRHPSDSDFDVYARDLPNVVSLDELCAPERDAVAWTQRARFSTFPSSHLKAVYLNVGEPTPDDVVQHLVSLVNTVAPKHSQSSILLDNIRNVYDWLKNNEGDAKVLLRRLSRQPLWLNIDSILDDWTWRTADELVFDLTFDVEASQRFMVRKFLAPYRSLLVNAGAHEFRIAILPPPMPSETSMTHLEMVRSGWNDLREAGQLLDICFIVQKQQIQAHRGMLAAMIPHFKTAFAGSFRESVFSVDDAELPVYPFPKEEATSAFAVQSVVDYVYTGTFKRPTFTTLDEATATAALDDLLDLMELSNFWNVSKLMNQAVQAMVELRLIRFDNCDDILARAEACQITVLIDICRKTKEQNQWVQND